MRRRVFRDMSGLYVPYAWTQKEKPYGVLTANGAEVLRPAGWVFWCPALFHLCLPDITSGHSQWDRSWGALFAGFRVEGAQRLISQPGALWRRMYFCTAALAPFSLRSVPSVPDA